tara:strand:- start:2203 stop:2556 length:354 start_codon:yes stop_codon:yes gene_type:complete
MSNNENNDGSDVNSEEDDYSSKLQLDLENFENSLYSACRQIDELSRELCDENKISENDYMNISNKTKDVYTAYNSVVDTMCVMNQHVSLVYEAMASNIKSLVEENTRLKVACQINDE